jgi:hypothetical protein
VLRAAAMHINRAQQRIATGATRAVHAWIGGPYDQPTRHPRRRSTADVPPLRTREVVLVDSGKSVWRIAVVVFSDATYVDRSGLGPRTPIRVRSLSRCRNRPRSA